MQLFYKKILFIFSAILINSITFGIIEEQSITVTPLNLKLQQGISLGRGYVPILNRNDYKNYFGKDSDIDFKSHHLLIISFGEQPRSSNFDITDAKQLEKNNKQYIALYLSFSRERGVQSSVPYRILDIPLPAENNYTYFFLRHETNIPNQAPFSKIRLNRLR